MLTVPWCETTEWNWKSQKQFLADCSELIVEEIAQVKCDGETQLALMLLAFHGHSSADICDVQESNGMQPSLASLVKVY